MNTMKIRGPGSVRVRPLLFFGTGVIAMALVCPYRFGITVGDSMEPTLRAGQPFLFVRAGEDTLLQRGDMVVVHVDGRPLIKRVFAVGGDRFWSFSGSPRSDWYTPIGPDSSIEDWKRRYPQFQYRQEQVPDDHLYLLGDNYKSLDSRELGSVPRATVHGVLLKPSGRQTPPLGNISVFYHIPPRPRPPAS